MLVDVLIKAANENSSVEAVCQDLSKVIGQLTRSPMAQSLTWCWWQLDPNDVGANERVNGWLML